MRKHAPRLGHRWPRQALRRSVGIRHLQTPLMKNLKLKERKTEWWVRDFGDCLNWKVCGYCLNWKVCFLILEEWRRWWVWANGGVVYPKKTKKKNRIAERCVRCVPDPAWKTKKEKEKKITCVGKSKRSDRGTLNVFLITKMPLETEF